MIGAKGMYALRYRDGSLCNNLYHDIARKIEATIVRVCTEQTMPVQISLMTFDTNGLSGHLDHIAVSYITTFVFCRLHKRLPQHARAKELLYFCMSKEQMPDHRLDYFVYMPEGRSEEFITRAVEVSEFVDRKFAVMRCHHSQRSDADYLIAKGAAFHATDYFHVVTGEQV
jgi:LmbE family N-acetylglucosaminyl deacetylase